MRKNYTRKNLMPLDSDFRRDPQSLAGFGMIETIISISIAGILMLALSTLILHTVKLNSESTKEMKALLYLRELIEVSKDIEQSNWAELENGSCYAPGVCHPEIVDGSWVFIEGEESLENGAYIRSFHIEDVYRSQTAFPNEIVGEDGVLDPATKKIVATLTRAISKNPHTEILEAYLYTYE
jgi:type II secretory pathway pseudopilin PulG